MFKTAIVIGGASNYLEDWNNFLKIVPDDLEFDVAVVNDQISTFDLAPISWVFTLHPEKLGQWFSARVKPTNANIVTMSKGGVTLDVEPFDIIDHKASLPASSSGGYAAYNLIQYYGYKRVVLVGVPMDSQKNHFRDEKEWAAVRSYQKAWNSDKARRLFTHMLRSMSGYTKELYGSPTTEWLKS